MATLAEILTELDTTASYAEDGSVAYAKRFRTALTRLIVKVPQQTGNAGTSTTLPISEYRAMLERVNGWLAVNDLGASGGGVRHVSLREFRT